MNVMQTFHYRAADTAGNIVSGDMTAMDRAGLFEKLQRENLTLIDARAEAGSTGMLDALTRARGGGYARRDLVHLFRSLSTFLKAGVTIDRGLKLFARLRGATPIGRLAARAAEEVRSGRSLSQILEAEGDRLPPILVPMIETGELAARLPQTTADVADLLERQQATQDEIVTALTYPIILLATALVAVVVITTIVLPQFEPLFERSDLAMPWISAVFLGFAGMLRSYGLGLLALLAAGAGGLLFGMRSPRFRERIDDLTLSMPLLGSVVAKVELARFFRSFGMLIQAGVALPKALQVACKGARNAHFAALFRDTEANVREGASLASCFEGRPHVPPIVAEFLTIGAEGGQIGPISESLAGLMSDEVQRFTQRFLRVLSPAITIGLGVFVAGLVASILLALLSLNDLAL